MRAPVTRALTPGEALSKLLFNAQHRLSVASVIRAADGEALRYEDIAGRAGLSRSVVHKELQVFVSIGAVQRLDLDRSVYFQAAASTFWAFCAELDELLRTDPPLLDAVTLAARAVVPAGSSRGALAAGH